MPLKTRLKTLYNKLPEPGDSLEIAPGVNWICMPLPFLPAFINCWLLEAEDGFTLIDTGVNNSKTKKIWESILRKQCTEKPLKRLIISHFHPDHIGLAGWFVQKFQVHLLMPQPEWLYARALYLLPDTTLGEIMVDFYRRCGCESEFLDYANKGGNTYAHSISAIPHNFRRIEKHQKLHLTESNWFTECSSGHSPAQLTLYNQEHALLIAADQILPHISPNISVWPEEPFGNPLQHYLDSLKDFEYFNADVTMLPSHGYPTKNIPQRLRQLAHHHDERLEIIYNSCKKPQTASEVAAAMLGGEVGLQHVFFAVGEALAHLNYLVEKGEIIRSVNSKNVWNYQQK